MGGTGYHFQLRARTLHRFSVCVSPCKSRCGKCLARLSAVLAFVLVLVLCRPTSPKTGRAITHRMLPF